MHPGGIIPPFKMHNVGTVPPFKMHSQGTAPLFKMHPVGTLSFDKIYFYEHEFGLHNKNKLLLVVYNFICKLTKSYFPNPYPLSFYYQWDWCNYAYPGRTVPKSQIHPVCWNQPLMNYCLKKLYSSHNSGVKVSTKFKKSFFVNYHANIQGMSRQKYQCLLAPNLSAK